MATKRLLTLTVVVILTYAMVPVATHAAATTVTINDLHDTVTGTAVGFDPNSLFVRAGLEAWDMHGEWISVNPPPVGVSIVVNINFLEPYNDGGSPVGSLSDALNMVFTGIASFPGDLDNVSLDLHFRSNPYAIGCRMPTRFNENGLFQDMSPFIVASGSPTDITVVVASDVPEPRRPLLMGSGSLGLAGVLRRRLGK